MLQQLWQQLTGWIADRDNLYLFQASKKEQLAERLASHAETSTSQTDAASREAAANAAIMGDGVGLSGRYRDSDFFIPDIQAGNRRFEEQEFSVKGGTGSQMDGAVLDLMADDQVSDTSFSIKSFLIVCFYALPSSPFSRKSSNSQQSWYWAGKPTWVDHIHTHAVACKTLSVLPA